MKYILVVLILATVVHATENEKWAVVHKLTGLKDPQSPERLIKSAAYDSKNKRLATVVYDDLNSTICLWNAQDGVLIDRLVGDKNVRVYPVTFDALGEQLAAGYDDSIVRIWDPKTGTVKKTLRSKNGRALSVAFHPDNIYLAAGYDGGIIRLWDTQSGNLCNELSDGNKYWVTSLAFSQDVTHLLSGSGDGHPRIWDVVMGSLYKKLAGHGGSIQCIAYNPTGDQVASGSTDNVVLLWNAKTGERDNTLDDQEQGSEWFVLVKYDSDGEEIVTVAQNATLVRWAKAIQKD